MKPSHAPQPHARKLDERFQHADRMRRARRHIELAIVEAEKSDVIDGERKLVV